MRNPPKNIGFVAKTLHYARLGKIYYPEDDVPSTRRPSLVSVFHHEQPLGTQPIPTLFKRGMQCFELVTSGRAWLKVNEEWKEVVPGCLLWHIPGDYTIGRSDPELSYGCLAVRFFGGNVIERRAPRITHWDDLDAVKSFTREVTRLQSMQDIDPQTLLFFIVGHLQLRAQLYAREQTRKALPAGLRQAVEVIDQSYGRALPLKKLAAAAGWSIPHLHVMFKEHLGQSPHQLLLRRRIQAARELLTKTDEPIKSVAAECGFTTTAAFCSQFKKITQLSPGEFRKRKNEFMLQGS